MTFNKAQALELLGLCEAAYPFCHGTACKLPDGFSDPVPVRMCAPLPKLLEDDTLSIFGFVTRKDGRAYLVFRGTQMLDGVHRLNEWGMDFYALPQLKFSCGSVHRGFAEVWQCVAASVSEALNGEKPIITGHSLGAAVATLAWLQLGGELMTFAGPRVGNLPIADALWKGNTIRVVNKPDIVPHVPADSQFFRHGGQEVTVHGPGDFFDAHKAHSLESYRAGLNLLK